MPDNWSPEATVRPATSRRPRKTAPPVLVTEADETPYPTPSRAWHATIVLLLVMALSYLDRTIVSLLVIPIQKDLGLSDSAMGVVLGPAFVFLYAILGLPAGYLADRYNRRNILAAGLVVWTLGTLACAASRSFEMLVAGRALVGMGEACVYPCAFSIAADYFPPNRRGRAIGVVATGVSIGAGTALFGGGILLQFASAIDTIHWPLFGQLQPWQIVFAMCGIPGFVILLILATVREPPRRGIPSAASLQDGTATGFLRFLLNNTKVVVAILFAYVLFAMIQYGLTSWAPTMLSRRLHLSVPDAAYIYGATVITVSPLAALSGGFVGDWMSRRWADGRVRMAVFVAPIFIPGTLLTCLSPHLMMVVLGLCLISASGTMVGTSVYASMQELAPSQFRGQMLAVYSLASGLLGMMVGPPMVALITDYVLHNPGKVNLSILAVCAPGAFIAWLLFAWGMRGFRALRTDC